MGLTTLKTLELFGFKSFAKHTTLEFSLPITAIVGPNGSGKSNVAEALRWVLGEQSIKSLRGRRGEDLIFHGSPTSPQLGKALVRLRFDNSAHILPLDFEEVVIARAVYRDGANEYTINGSAVRLKDVIELLSAIGIGGSAHHIIGQGEADRILYASPRERRSMLEDALGLRIYEIKRAEAERKLEHTEENMKQVEALRKEIQPHLRFLKAQVGKQEASETVEKELSLLFEEYLGRECASVEEERAREERERAPGEEKQRALLESIDRLRKAIEEGRKKEGERDLGHATRSRVRELEEKRRALERELGRVEGRITAHGAVSTRYMRGEVERILALADELLNADSFEIAREKAMRLKTVAEKFLGALHGAPGDMPDELKEEMGRIQGILKEVESAYREQTEVLKKEEQAFSAAQRARQKEEELLREKERELFSVRDVLHSGDMARERTRMRYEEFLLDKKEAERLLGIRVDRPKGNVLTRQERDSFRRDIQKRKLKLEEMGAVDESTLKEYEEVTRRDVFLTGELEDLEKAAKSLRDLMKELEKRLEQDFLNGIEKINKEFTALFQGMFGGGKALLRVEQQEKRYEKRRGANDGEDNEQGEERGVAVTVELPKKRIKSLDTLSGGERALTSIALLFAMTITNPPPFLVLDETDAALDEANSQRYGKMLRGLSRKTQLVVVTHNRQTMKEAGILYGITMGADGISRILSLKFEEAEEMSGKAHDP